MTTLLWLIPFFPLAGFLILAIWGKSAPRSVVAAVGAGSVAISALITVLVGTAFLVSPPAGNAATQTLWTWMDTAGFTAPIGFYLDAVSLLMVAVVTFVGLLIHIYSTAFMYGDEGYSRYFAYMNLFVASMLILVLADNLLLLYLGWEGVGLCSYLLIGFWYEDPEHGRAAQKAFLVTRVGDAAMAVGLFLLFWQLGTLDIQGVMSRASQLWTPGAVPAVATAALLLAGALGKSAQLPLQTWLPDAMAGPTPVSALIHAATMVTAGVYLIARMHVLFILAPAVQTAVAVIGAVTLVLAGFSGLVQYDIKRVLAYSTISQIGYMFLALGVGAWSAAMFHLMTHAFFKALLFLAAGCIIITLNGEHDMRKMGGLWRQLPVVFWTFLIGAASLAAVPVVTAGFYSKDLILSAAWTSPVGSVWLWGAGVVGALLTSLYTFRMVVLTFFGKAHQHAAWKPGFVLRAPLVILAFLSLVGGLVEMPKIMGGTHLLSHFLHTALPESVVPPSLSIEWALEITAGSVSLVGILVACLLFAGRRQIVRRLAATSYGARLHRLWQTDWGFDWAYDRVFVRPFVRFARADRADAADLPFQGIASTSFAAWRLLRRTQTGKVRWYAAGLALGAVLLTALVILL